jgi:hypothetical protein
MTLLYTEVEPYLIPTMFSAGLVTAQSRTARRAGSVTVSFCWSVKFTDVESDIVGKMRLSYVHCGSVRFFQVVNWRTWPAELSVSPRGHERFQLSLRCT